MGTETEKKNFVDYLMIGIVIICISAIIITAFLKAQSGYFFESKAYLSIVFIIFPTFGFIVPLNSYIKKGHNRKKTALLFLGIRGLIVTLFISSIYRIFYSEDYSLKFTYWIALISFVTIMIIPFAEVSLKDYKKRKAEGKKRIILYLTLSALIPFLWPGISGYNLALKYTYPKKQIVLNNLKLPKSITIYMLDRKFNRVSPDFKSKIEILSVEDIKTIIKDLHSAKVESITGTSVMNFSRMKDNNFPYYQLMLHYTDSNSWDNVLEDGYIDYIVVTANRNTVIEEIKARKRLILGTGHYYETYPINLSQETVDMIFSYITSE